MRPVAILLFCLVSVFCSADPSPTHGKGENHQAKAKENTKPVAITFDGIELLKTLNLKELPLDIEKKLPEKIAKLNNKTVTIEGWMYPPNAEEGLKAFLFVRSNDITSFGRRHSADEKIAVRMKTGLTTDYIQGRPFLVTGTFKIQPKVSEGELFFLYLIADAVVTEKVAIAEPVKPSH